MIIKPEEHHRYCYSAVWSCTARTNDDGVEIGKSPHALLYKPNIIHNPLSADVLRSKARGAGIRCVKDRSER